MKVAYICHHTRPNYEFEWLNAMPNDEVVFISTSDHTTRGNYVKVSYQEKGWENKFFASTARRVYYSDFESSIEDVDIVVVLEVFSSLSRQFVEYCNKVNKPVVVLVYELINSHPIYKLPSYRKNTEVCIKNADHFVAVSDAAAKHLTHLGAKKDKITVVYPGVNRAVFKPDYNEREENSIIFVGKLERHKGIDMMLDSFQEASKMIPNLTLSVVGTGSMKDDVEAFSRTNPAVKYYDFVKNDKLPPLLNKHSIYVLPARETRKLGFLIGAEQFGFSVVEAMSCGLPVIVSDVGALPEIVTAKNPVFKKNNTEDLTQKLIETLQDKKRMATLRSYNAKKASLSYDLATQADLLGKLLKTVRDSKV